MFLIPVSDRCGLMSLNFHALVSNPNINFFSLGDKLVTVCGLSRGRNGVYIAEELSSNGKWAANRYENIRGSLWQISLPSCLDDSNKYVRMEDDLAFYMVMDKGVVRYGLYSDGMLLQVGTNIESMKLLHNHFPCLLYENRVYKPAVIVDIGGSRQLLEFGHMGTQLYYTLNSGMFKLGQIKEMLK